LTHFQSQQLLKGRLNFEVIGLTTDTSWRAGCSPVCCGGGVGPSFAAGFHDIWSKRLRRIAVDAELKAVML
jgi:hypothetical protein